ncbi:MAG: signal peptidase I [Candidatus Staskawiczbacteria bacterium]|nr:signal peptidase I [Candidatus Staskawiczbacteria bacterium]
MDSETKEEKIEEAEKIKEEAIKDRKIRKVIKQYSPFVLELVKIAIIAFVIVAPIRYFLFQPFIVSGASMAPNFATGDYLIVDEISYRLSAPQRGDVVVFDASFIKGYTGQRFIKRMIGLPGETVDITDGKIEIVKDDKSTILNEKYLPDNLKTYGNVNITLKPNEYFVMGDNREYSYDSRMWGVVPAKYIIGKAALRVLPITSLSKIEIVRPTY